MGRILSIISVRKQRPVKVLYCRQVYGRRGPDPVYSAQPVREASLGAARALHLYTADERPRVFCVLSPPGSGEYRSNVKGQKMEKNGSLIVLQLPTLRSHE